MKTPVSLKLLLLACAVAPFTHAASDLKSTDVTLVSALAADETLGGTLTVSLNELANDSLARRISERVRSEAARVGYARVCITQVERDTVAPRENSGGHSVASMVTLPNGDSFSMSSAGAGFKLRRVSGELVVREVIKKSANR